jgi:NAD+ kinase
MERVGLVVHPSRGLAEALATVEAWADERGAELVQVRTPGSERDLAPPGAAESCQLIIALGGDGTALAALRAAGPSRRPVLGVACGSLGALTATTAEELRDALEQVSAGDWVERTLPALVVEQDDGGPLAPSLNDFVMVRRGAGQVSASVRVDGELFVRFAGDGLVVATPLGSSAYTLAAGGPVVAPGALGMVVTPLAPHGGCCPPLVAGADARVAVELEPGHGGARLEGDGQSAGEVERLDIRRLTFTLRRAHAVLVNLGDQEPMLAGLRRRRVIIDSPRLLARDDREAARPYR